ncbi:MAG: exo-alpha-sialidase [Planctomycetes bacterium]|nr:exo-alpha-sialidase [Planctomycetota bacterium]
MISILALSLALSPSPQQPAPAAAGEPSRVTVFASGTDGYHTFRIPAIVAAGGDLVALAEGRKGGRGDAGDIDLVMRRSSDGGATWSKLAVVWDDGDNTCGNPCLVVDRTSGAILLLATHNLGRDREHQIIAGESEGTRTVWLLRSDDGGRTWSKPKEITATAKRPDWTWYATGPGAGIQLERGEHAGRLVVPCDHIEKGSKHYHSHVIWSDDHGVTWQLGGSSPRHQVNECEVVERADGCLLLNMRNYDRSQHTRQVCVSRDGGATWSDQHHDPALVEPICQASVRRIAWPDGDRAGLIAFSNPAHADKRENLTLRLSLDDGATWIWSRCLEPGAAAYSCLVALPAVGADPAGCPDIGCLFEAFGYRRIELLRLPAADYAALR